MSVKIIGPKDRKLLLQLQKDPSKIIINTTSHSADFGKGLSPFLNGPVELYDGLRSNIVENGWQYTKVYPQHADEWGEPTAAYWRWAKDGWSRTSPVRYPMGKGSRPLYTLWEGKKLGYVESRKKVFIPLYSSALRITDAYHQLETLYKERPGDLVLWDFDGYDYKALGMTLEECVDEPSRIMGHAFVLALMLDNKV